MFQTLIGTVKSIDWYLVEWAKERFQTLIGTVKSSTVWARWPGGEVFQTLIGTVKRGVGGVLRLPVYEVSNPHRYGQKSRSD